MCQSGWIGSASSMRALDDRSGVRLVPSIAILPEAVASRELPLEVTIDTKSGPVWLSSQVPVTIGPVAVHVRSTATGRSLPLYRPCAEIVTARLAVAN